MGALAPLCPLRMGIRKKKKGRERRAPVGPSEGVNPLQTSITTPSFRHFSLCPRVRLEGGGNVKVELTLQAVAKH